MASIDTHTESPTHATRQPLISRLFQAWLIVVILYFFWEAVTYRGLYARLAEWQFDWLGYYMPILTYGGLVLLFATPALWLLRTGGKRDADAPPLPDEGERIVDAGNRLRRIFMAVSAGFVVAALATLLWTLTITGFSAPTRTLVVGTPESTAPRAGPTYLRGETLYPRTALFTQDLLFFFERDVRFAPVVAPGSKNRSIRYFVELARRPAIDKAEGTPAYGDPRTGHSGVLMRSDLPGSIRKLYGYAGLTIEKPYFVLYRSPVTMRWPYYAIAVQLMLGALVAFIAALLQHRHVRRVQTSLETSSTPVST